jgi:hypothetical protein
MNDQLIDSKTLAKDILKLGSERSLEAWRRRGYGPAFIRISPRAVRYRKQDVEAWLSERRVGHETESPAR